MLGRISQPCSTLPPRPSACTHGAVDRRAVRHLCYLCYSLLTNRIYPRIPGTHQPATILRPSCNHHHTTRTHQTITEPPHLSQGRGYGISAPAAHRDASADVPCNGGPPIANNPRPNESRTASSPNTQLWQPERGSSDACRACPTHQARTVVRRARTTTAALRPRRGDGLEPSDGVTARCGGGPRTRRRSPARLRLFATPRDERPSRASSGTAGTTESHQSRGWRRTAEPAVRPGG